MEAAVLNAHLIDEARRHFNEPVLILLEVYRVIGYAEDEDDCYLMVLHPKRGRLKHTFVGGYTYLSCLKGQDHAGPWDDFLRLDSLLELNGAPKQAEFLVEIAKPSEAEMKIWKGD